MKAMTYRGPFRVRVEEKPVPKILHPNDAIVRVTRGAICGSDIHLYHRLMADLRVGHKRSCLQHDGAGRRAFTGGGQRECCCSANRA